MMLKIDKIEEEQDANDEKYDKDVERVDKLAESGAISEEEAEARKRAAKSLTEAKNAELEKQNKKWHVNKPFGKRRLVSLKLE